MKAAAVFARLFLCLALVAGGGAFAFAQSEEDKAKIAELKQKAEQGDAIAQYNLGDKYLSGDGVLPNYKEAARLYGLAAEQNHFLAQYRLGFMYLRGKGFEQDYSEAYIRFALLALNAYGNVMELAVEKRQEAEEKLTSDELNEAQAEAAERLEKIKEKQAAQ